ncbi:hypothetical protein P4233_16195 [Pseudomonas aeruginosa]|nr:hypothetical protein [Pseudomonas aeruginosa]
MWEQHLLPARQPDYRRLRQCRWCPNIIGPLSGGAVEDLPVHLMSPGAAAGQDPHRSAGLRSPRIRTGRGWLHPADHAQGQ